MMDRYSFLSQYGTTKELTFEFESAELWLDKNVLPYMIEAARSGESSLEFDVEINPLDINAICNVLEKKGYTTSWWPVVSKLGGLHCPTKRMKIEVSW